MVPQLEQNLLHLVSGGKSLNQYCCPDSIVRYPDVRLGEHEDIVPETGLEIMLHLWEIKVRPRAAFNKFFGVVVKVQGEIEEGAGNRGSVDCHTRFVEMPTSRAKLR
jgi:hypothetical protein